VVVPGTRATSALVATSGAVEFALQIGRNGFEVHEVAEAPTRAFSHLVLATAGFAEVRDGRELAVDGQSVIPSVVKIGHRLGCVFFLTEFDVNVADQVIAQIVADVHFLHFSVLVLHLQKDVFEKVIVVLLLFHVRDCGGGFRGRGRVLQVPITILENDGLGESGFVVQPGAGGSVTASADFDVKRTVDFVLFRSENRSQIFGHFNPF